MKKKTTHAEHGGTTKSNLHRIIEKRTRLNLDIRKRPRLCKLTNEISLGVYLEKSYFFMAILSAS